MNISKNVFKEKNVAFNGEVLLNCNSNNFKIPKKKLVIYKVLQNVLFFCLTINFIY